jgi:hypothetical protein
MSGAGEATKFSSGKLVRIAAALVLLSAYIRDHHCLRRCDDASEFLAMVHDRGVADDGKRKPGMCSVIVPEQSGLNVQVPCSERLGEQYAAQRSFFVRDLTEAAVPMESLRANANQLLDRAGHIVRVMARRRWSWTRPADADSVRTFKGSAANESVVQVLPRGSGRPFCFVGRFHVGEQRGGSAMAGPSPPVNQHVKRSRDRLTPWMRMRRRWRGGR